MPTSTTGTFLYLGNFADVDPDETDQQAENASSLIGTYSNLSLVDVTSVDQDDNNAIRDDEVNGVSNDRMRYDTGSGPQDVEADSTMLYNVSVKLGDGSTITTDLVVVQSSSGDLFVLSNSFLDDRSIQSVTLNSVTQDTAGGYAPGRSIDNSSIVCFASGTRIKTPVGDRPIEALQAGDVLETWNGDLRPIKWIGCRRVVATGSNRPVRIAPGALAQGIPRRQLVVSKQHRILIQSPIVLRMTGARRAFIPAKDLIGLPGVDHLEVDVPITYWHLLLDVHPFSYRFGSRLRRDTLFGPGSCRHPYRYGWCCRVGCAFWRRAHWPLSSRSARQACQEADSATPKERHARRSRTD